LTNISELKVAYFPVGFFYRLKQNYAMENRIID